ncbi:MAG: hypothetical protein PUB69_03335 [Desulfovibrionaceae bacterium]|nr:hypothetical protein [Desulfovibrionaceae bacterium]
MKILAQRIFAAALALGLAFGMTACAPGNVVHLSYTSSQSNILPQPQAKRLAVVMFDDQRMNSAIGVRKDGASFTADSSVADWVGRAFAEELKSTGTQVSYAATLNQARNGRPDYILTGIVRELWVKENGPTSYTATIRVTLSLSNAKGVIYSENLTATQDRQSLPTSTALQSLLADTLRDLISPAMSKMRRYVDKK